MGIEVVSLPCPLYKGHKKHIAFCCTQCKRPCAMFVDMTYCQPEDAAKYKLYMAVIHVAIGNITKNLKRFRNWTDLFVTNTSQ